MDNKASGSVLLLRKMFPSATTTKNKTFLPNKDIKEELLNTQLRKGKFSRKKKEITMGLLGGWRTKRQKMVNAKRKCSKI